MKVVINKCYGGFGLSYDAKLALANTPCKHINKMTPEEYYGINWEAKAKEDLLKPIDSIFFTMYYEGKILTDDHRNDNNRACEYLVAICESLEEDADGEYSKLKIVEIPDGTNFEIEDYDGMESIHQTHQSWG